MAWATSRAHYTRALAPDPSSTCAQSGLGRLLLLAGKPEEARKYLEMAVRSDPLDGPAHFQLAETYRRLQMLDKAEKENHLFQEINKAKEQVEGLYRQMHRPDKSGAGEVPGSASSPQ